MKKRSKALLIIAGIAMLGAAALAAVLIFINADKIPSVALNSEHAVTLEVGGLCHFVESEKQSVHYRWAYYISDESLVGVYSSEYKDRSGLNTRDGGDKGLRKLVFEALAPGECTITLRCEDIDNGERYSDERIYTVVIAGGSAASQPPMMGIQLEKTTVLHVGGICHFVEDEKQSIPYRWAYTISDEKVMGIFADEYEDRSGPDAMDGGDEGLRKLFFQALTPGKCVITLRYEDVRDASATSEHKYAVTVPGLKAYGYTGLETDVFDADIELTNGVMPGTWYKAGFTLVLDEPDDFAFLCPVGPILKDNLYGSYTNEDILLGIQENASKITPEIIQEKSSRYRERPVQVIDGGEIARKYAVEPFDVLYLAYDGGGNAVGYVIVPVAGRR